MSHAQSHANLRTSGQVQNNNFMAMDAAMMEDDEEEPVQMDMDDYDQEVKNQEAEDELDFNEFVQVITHVENLENN